MKLFTQVWFIMYFWSSWRYSETSSLCCWLVWFCARNFTICCCKGIIVSYEKSSRRRLKSIPSWKYVYIRPIAIGWSWTVRIAFVGWFILASSTQVSRKIWRVSPLRAWAVDIIAAICPSVKTTVSPNLLFRILRQNAPIDRTAIILIPAYWLVKKSTE